MAATTCRFARTAPPACRVGAAGAGAARRGEERTWHRASRITHASPVPRRQSHEHRRDAAMEILHHAPSIAKIPGRQRAAIQLDQVDRGPIRTLRVDLPAALWRVSTAALLAACQALANTICSARWSSTGGTANVKDGRSIGPWTSSYRSFCLPSTSSAMISSQVKRADAIVSRISSSAPHPSSWRSRTSAQPQCLAAPVQVRLDR